VQFFAVGTSGTDFAISSATDTHTFNLPTASATNRGALSSTDWTTFNNKQNALTNPVTGTGTTNQIPKFTGASTLGNSNLSDDGSAVTCSSELRVLGALNGTTASLTSTGTHLSFLRSTFNTFTISVGTASGISGLLFGNNTAGTFPLIISQTNGAATFSNSVTANGTFIVNTGTGATLRAIFSTTNQIEVGNYNATDGYRELALTGSLLTLYTGTAGGGSVSERARITSGGNLLVGTTTDAGFKLDVNGTGRFSNQITGPSGAVTEGKFNFIGYNNGYGGITANTGFDSSYNSVILYSNFNSNRSGQGNTSIPSWQLDLGGSFPNQDSFGIYRSAAGSFTFTNLFKITSSGNVGIGTSSPSQLLHLKTELATGSGVGTAILIESGGSGGDQGWIGVNKGSGNGLEFSVENRDIIFNTAATTPFGGTERMRITSSGNVGIGTSSPSSKLEIVGGDEMLYLRNSTTSTIAGRIGTRTDGAMQIYSFQSGVGYKPIMLGVDASTTAAGNVLIGTTTDQGAKLEVVGDSYLRTRVFTDTIRPYTGDQLQLLNGGNNFLFINGKLRITGLPTSSSGLSSGDVWNDSGTLKIV
jgi:hypothetical protein